MTVGGRLRIHGRVSFKLLKNLIDYQGAWRLAKSDLSHSVIIEAAEIDYDAKSDPGPRPRSILAFTGGVDSTFALCHNASEHGGLARHNIGAAIMIDGINSGPSTEKPRDVLADLRRISGAWDVPTGMIRFDIFKLYDAANPAIGVWVAASLSLFSGSFNVGLIGAIGDWLRPTYDVFGSHPLLDPYLSSGQMAIRHEGAQFTRAEKIKLLASDLGGIDNLRVCFFSEPGLRNCCRCEKCIRTMLTCIAVGHEVPAAFPLGLRLQDIGIGMGNSAVLFWAAGVIAASERWDTGDHPAMRRLGRRYRTKRVKVAAKTRFSQIRQRLTGLRRSR